MKLIVTFLIVFLFLPGLFPNAVKRAVLIHNSLDDIDACKGKLKLKLVRIWGGDKEEDENKFFETPTSIAVDKSRSLVYICDMHTHCVKVFEHSGKYIRTLGRRGRGPGDVFGPDSIALSPYGDLVVCEIGGFRIQRFNTEGKSKNIIKLNSYFRCVGITSKDEVALYGHFSTFRQRNLITIIDENGKPIRKVGTYHDKSNNELEAESLTFTIGKSDHFYAANTLAPVIRKYSPEGLLLMAITMEPPVEIPIKITLNDRGDEIERIEPDDDKKSFYIKKVGRRVTTQRIKLDKPRGWGFSAIGTDPQDRIYAVTRKRLLTEKEIMATRVSGSLNKSLNRKLVDYDIVENIDAFRLLVFSPKGKVIAEAQMTTFCDGIHIAGNRIFIIDGLLNQRVLEYEMSFEK